MSTLIILSAVPGSGKSTWAKQYIEQHPGTKIVASDELRLEFFGKVNCFDDEPRVWRTFLERINGYAESDPNCTVIADSTNLQNKYRRYYHDATPKFDKHVLVVFNIPFEIAEKQNKMRHGDRVVPEDGMKRLEAEWEAPTQEIIDLYDEVIIVGKSFVAPESK